MQIPHWAAPAATNAAWSGCGSSGVPRPRTVVTARPSAWTASARHELMARPSSSTAQAPQSPRSHPDLTSVAARRFDVHLAGCRLILFDLVLALNFIVFTSYHIWYLLSFWLHHINNFCF